MRVLMVGFLGFLLHGSASAQCCSPGNPFGGTTNIGILDKKSLRAISFYQYGLSEQYWEGNKKSDFSFVKNASYNYAGLILGYGLFNKLTLETELGYFINRSQTYNIEPAFTNKGFGFSNGYASLKYNVIATTINSFEWTIGAGAKFPFAKKYQMVNNSELPIDIQPSTHAFGTITHSFLYKGFPEITLDIFLIHRFETNAPDHKHFKFGNFLMSSIFLNKQIGSTNFSAILQARHEYRTKNISNVDDAGFAGLFATGTHVNSSGGHLIFIAPQINYTIAQTWNLSLLADLPVYRYYNGTQLGNKFAFAVYLSRTFDGGTCDENEEKN